uniref:BrnA antitoxin of type II toxin-antitoxin system n=1 Tax=Candidatus Kentrum sp. FW TaxID=2126338 RepID=A0A450S9B6_9GAMM|nr:MAG: hypothetical protein BECKFW1821A_GA0114235_102035 [Candidatus Kentron sp. FW]
MKKQYDKALTLEELAKQPDSEIDYSDIPELDESFWDKAKITRPRMKSSIRVRVSQEVLDFFKAKNPREYTSHMAAMLICLFPARLCKQIEF